MTYEELVARLKEDIVKAEEADVEFEKVRKLARDAGVDISKIEAKHTASKARLERMKRAVEAGK